MKKSINRFFKGIKKFFTDKNNKTVKSRRMFYGITLSFVAIAAVVAIIMVTTGSVNSAFKSSAYAHDVIHDGNSVSFKTGSHLFDELKTKSYTMHIEQQEADYPKVNYVYTHTVAKDKSVTCTLYCPAENTTYKSVTKNGKTTYSCDIKGNNSPNEEEIKGNIESLSTEIIFQPYLSTNVLNCYTHENRTFFINNLLVEETVYLCSNEGSTKLEYGEIRFNNAVSKFTFEYK